MASLPIREFMQAEFNPLVNKEGCDPFDAYVILVEQLAKRGIHYDTYAQATLTSGGHARNPDLNWEEILLANVAFAQGMAETLYNNGQLEPRHTVEASTLGLIRHWNERDYITFWFNVLARPEATSDTDVGKLRKLYTQSIDRNGVIFEKFNNYNLPNSERASEYIHYADAAVEALQAYQKFDVVSRLVAVSETEGSLGASTEKYFTKKLGGTAYSLAIAHMAGENQLPEGAAPAWLRKDVGNLVYYGAQIFDPRSHDQIIVVKDQ